MKIQITFKDGKTQDIELADGGTMPTPMLGTGDAAYLTVISKESNTFVYNWDVIKHVRSFHSETSEAKKANLPSVDA